MSIKASEIKGVGSNTRPGAVNDRAAILFDLGIEAGLQLAAQRALLTRIASAAGLGDDGDLNPCEPLRPADDNTGIGLNPCPIYAWCMGHEPGESVTAASLHYGETHHASAADLYVHTEDRVPSVAFNPEQADTTLLDPDEAESLAHALLLFASAARSVTA